MRVVTSGLFLHSGSSWSLEPWSSIPQNVYGEQQKWMYFLSLLTELGILYAKSLSGLEEEWICLQSQIYLWHLINSHICTGRSPWFAPFFIFAIIACKYRNELGTICNSTCLLPLNFYLLSRTDIKNNENKWAAHVPLRSNGTDAKKIREKQRLRIERRNCP